MKNDSMSTVNVNTGARGFRVTEVKYRCIRKAILANLPRSADGLSFGELVARIRTTVGIREELFPKSGSVMWYTKVVQLDLEKRGLIERVHGVVPQRLRRVK